jgi:hypothetical protein
MDPFLSEMQVEDLDAYNDYLDDQVIMDEEWDDWAEQAQDLYEDYWVDQYPEFDW